MLQTQRQLSRAQPAIDQKLAMISRDQCAVSRAPAPEHRQAEHGFQDSRVTSICANGNSENDERRRNIENTFAEMNLKPPRRLLLRLFCKGVFGGGLFLAC
jgi:hypothetical protein